MSDEEDTASIVTGGVGYNIGSPSVFLSSRNSLDSISNFSFFSDANNNTSQSLADFNSNNNLTGSANSYSPLGSNSVFELIASIQNKRKNKVALMVNNKTTRVPLGHPTQLDIPQVQLAKIEKVEDSKFDNYVEKILFEYETFEKSNLLTQSALHGNINNSDLDIKDVPMTYFKEDFRLDDPQIFYQVIEGNDILSNDNDHSNASFKINSDEIQERLTQYLDIVEVHLIQEISKSSSSFFSTLEELNQILTECETCHKECANLAEKFKDIDNKKVKPNFELLKKLTKKVNVMKLQQSILQVNLVLKIIHYAELVFSRKNLDALRIQSDDDVATKEYSSNVSQDEFLKSLVLLDLAESLFFGKLSEFQEKLNEIIADDSNHLIFIVDSSSILEILSKLKSLKFNQTLTANTLQSQDLSKVESLKSVYNVLFNLRLKIGEFFSQSLVNFLSADLQRSLDSTAIQSTLMSLLVKNMKYENKIVSQNLNLLLVGGSLIDNDASNRTSYSNEFKYKIMKYLYGLIRSNKVFQFFKDFQEMLILQFKTIIKSHLQSMKPDNLLLPSKEISKKIFFNTIFLNKEENCFETMSFHELTEKINETDDAEDNDITTDIFQGNANDSNISLSNSTSNSGSASSNSKASMNTNQIIINNLRSMTDPLDFEIIIINTYTNLLTAFNKVSLFQKLLLDISLDLIQYSPSNQSTEDTNIYNNLDLTSAIGKLLEVVNKRLFKILSIKADHISNSSLTSAEYFSKFYILSKMFLINDENLRVMNINDDQKRPPNFLGRFLAKQTSDYYASYTSNLKRITVELIERDLWKDLGSLGTSGENLQKEGQSVLDEILNICDSIYEDEENSKEDLKNRFVRLPETWSAVVCFTQYLKRDILICDDHLKVSATMSNKNLAGLEKSVLSPSKKKDFKKLVMRCNSKETSNPEPVLEIIVPRFMIAVLKSMKELLILHLTIGKQNSSFPFVLIDLVRVVNTLMKNQILGANATKTSDLKHITTKQLSICSQALELLIELIPYLKTIILTINNVNLNKKVFLRSNEIPNDLSEENGVNVKLTIEEEFSRLIQNLKVHQNDIFSKLISIMDERTMIHVSELSKVDFSQKIPETGCHKYMESLVKETLTMSKGVMKYLPKGQYLLILSQIFNNYKIQFLKEFGKIISVNDTTVLTNLTSSNGRYFDNIYEKMNLLKDIDYFRVKLCDVPGYGESGTVLWEFVNKINTAEDLKTSQTQHQSST